MHFVSELKFKIALLKKKTGVEENTVVPLRHESKKRGVTRCGQPSRREREKGLKG